MTLDFVPVWTAILAFGVFMYVLLDGFDLGVGILFPFAPDDRGRDLMMASVAPIWDGNETWLVFGSLALFSAFPLAFAIIIPALYFPILAMVTGLIFRGIAFEFRPNARTTSKRWDWAFFCGSLIATFAQGCVLGKFVLGFAVSGRQYAGTSWDWLHPFVLAVGVGLVFGYLLLGASWLVMKTQGALQDWARAKARVGLIGVLVFIAMVSLWTPFLDARIGARWFSWPNIAFLAPVPVGTAAIAWRLWASLRRGRDVAPFAAAMGLFAMCYLGLAISLFPYIVPPTITLWDAAAAPRSQAFLLIGTLFLLPIILMYTGWSYWVFRGKVKIEMRYH
jgi:cytochrome bd ubiquinol oxidase subunit II